MDFFFNFGTTHDTRHVEDVFVCGVFLVFLVFLAPFLISRRCAATTLDAQERKKEKDTCDRRWGRVRTTKAEGSDTTQSE